MVGPIDVVTTAGVPGRIRVQRGAGEPQYGVGALVLGARRDLVRLRRKPARHALPFRSRFRPAVSTARPEDWQGPRVCAAKGEGDVQGEPDGAGVDVASVRGMSRLRWAGDVQPVL